MSELHDVVLQADDKPRRRHHHRKPSGESGDATKAGKHSKGPREHKHRPRAERDVDFSDPSSKISTPGFRDTDEIVLKEYLKEATHSNLERSRFLIDLETQAVAMKLALEFNDRMARVGGAPWKIKFLKTKVIKFKDPVTGSHRFMSMEKRFRGGVEMVKLTGNYGFIRSLTDASAPSVTPVEGRGKSGLIVSVDKIDIAVAFSHFTHSHTKGYLLVCDIQGIETSNRTGADTLLLTDPAIHCPSHMRFGTTNLQQKGVDKFFSTHTCNKYCTSLGLKKP